MTDKRKILSLILKCIVAVSAVVGITMSAMAGSNGFMAGHTVFMFFTVQSNILVALISLAGACFLLTKKDPGMKWYVLKYVGTVAITLTGVVFCFVLAPTLGKLAWNFQNILTHVVVPLAAIADFFVSAPENGIDKKYVPLVMVPPLLYAVYAGIGYILGWQFAPGYNYPYFFLHWGSPAGAFGFSRSLPFMGCVWWIVLLMLFLYGVGRCYLWALNKTLKK